MQKINRLGWVEGACLTAYGVRVGMRATEHGAIADLVPFLPPHCHFVEPPAKLDALYSWVVGKNEARLRNFGIMYAGVARIARTLDRQELLDAFATSVRMSVALYSPRFVFIHAGAVAWRNRAIIIPGRSLSGKSTLVEELVRSGAEYLSDEYAVLDSRGYVHPFAQPISRREAGSFIQRAIEVEKIGGTIARRPVPVAMILTTHYRESAQSRFRAAPRTRGALDLVANAIAARFAPARVMRAAAAATQNAVILRGRRGEAQAAAERLLQILETARFSPDQRGGDIHDGTRPEFALVS